MRIRAAIAAAAVFLALSSCGSEKEFSALGTWKGELDGAEMTMVFNADNTGSYAMEDVFAYDVVYEKYENGFLFSFLSNGEATAYHLTVKDSMHALVEEIGLELEKQP
ncbi:MAG: hypothetical protein LBC69_01660 [Eubacteriaceae bacterium]|jgi:hypothetical protein|nr:hypothetical protein [Eubacteriaceae bacterium]